MYLVGLRAGEGSLLEPWFRELDFLDLVFELDLSFFCNLDDFELDEKIAFTDPINPLDHRFFFLVFSLGGSKNDWW